MSLREKFPRPTPDGRTYSVMIDDEVKGIYNASAQSREYGSLLYTQSGLADTNHTLTLTNLEQGKRLSFDRLDYMSGL